jgi:hypothetical protein
MVGQVERAVDTAIAGATLDMEAPEGEQVAFVPAQLEVVVRLYRARATRDKTLAVINARLAAAFKAYRAAATREGGATTDPAVHDAFAAWTLQERLKGTKDVTFTSADGFFALVGERSLTEDGY